MSSRRKLASCISMISILGMGNSLDNAEKDYEAKVAGYVDEFEGTIDKAVRNMNKVELETATYNDGSIFTSGLFSVSHYGEITVLFNSIKGEFEKGSVGAVVSDEGMKCSVEASKGIIMCGPSSYSLEKIFLGENPGFECRYGNEVFKMDDLDHCHKFVDAAKQMKARYFKSVMGRSRE